MSKDQAQMLAALAIAVRPIGSPHWDEAGVVAAIAKLHTLMLADVAHAVLRAAEDKSAKTPGVIAATSSIHWRERSPHHVAALPPKREEACLDCGAHLDACRCGNRTVRLPGKNPRNTQHAQAARAALRGATEGDVDE